MRHRVLERQMKRLGLGPDQPPCSPEQWAQFLDRIDQSYYEADQDRYLLERSLSISSHEMQDLYDRLLETSIETEERHRTLLHRLPVGVYRTTPNGRIIEANAAAAELLGAESVEALQALNAWDLFSQVPGRNRYMAELIRKGTITAEFALQRIDGKMIWVRAMARTTKDALGNVVYFDGILTDITERKRAEVALREGEARSRALLEAIPDLMFRLRSDGTILDYKGEEDDLIMPSDQIIGANLADVPKSPQLVEDWFRCLKQAITTGEMQFYEYELPLPRGTQAFEARMVRCGEDEALCIIRNVTARRRAEQRLRLLEASVYASLDGITISEVDSPDYPLIYVSPGFERLTGYAAEEALGRNCRFLQNDDQDQPALDEIRDALKSGAQCRVVLRNYRKDGTLFWNELTLYPLYDKTGRLRHYVGIQRDITERKQAEQALARINAELEQRNRELQDFAHVASHDLQEPLRKIRAFADLMQEDYGDKVDATGHYYLDRMQDAATRMAGLITDLLVYSRVTTRVRPFGKVDLNAVVTDVLSDLEMQIQETGGKVNVGKLPVLDADATQMRQLLQNFIGNALKFHQEGRPPVVEVSGTTETYTTSDGNAPQTVCRLEVRDNGIGFDEKYLDRIFSPFQRLHGRGTYAGTGMGLAICRRIVERHHGSINVRSAPGKGAAFVVMLPLQQPPISTESDTNG